MFLESFYFSRNVFYEICISREHLFLKKICFWLWDTFERNFVCFSLCWYLQPSVTDQFVFGGIPGDRPIDRFTAHGRKGVSRLYVRVLGRKSGCLLVVSINLVLFYEICIFWKFIFSIKMYLENWNFRMKADFVYEIYIFIEKFNLF